MSAQVIQLEHHEVSKTTSLPKEQRSGGLITMGTVIGMIHMVMGAIIEAIEKSGKTARTYLKANLKAIVDAAEHMKVSQEKGALGMKNSAWITIGLSAVAMGASGMGVRHSMKTRSEMANVQKTPIGQPSLGSGSAIEMSKMSKPPASVAQGAQASQANVSSIRARPAELPKPQGKTFASEAEKNREMKMLEEKAAHENPWDKTQGATLSIAQSAGGAEKARLDDAAAKDRYAGEVVSGLKDSIGSQRRETEGFFGSLPAQIDKLGVAHIVVETIKAATQWR